MDQIIVYKHRTTTVQLSLPYDVSGDTITSQIREGESSESTIIATWVVTELSAEPEASELVLTLDNSITSQIDKSIGYMDIKRLSGGEPLTVFDGVLEVLFKEPVTA